MVEFGVGGGREEDDDDEIEEEYEKEDEAAEEEEAPAWSRTLRMSSGLPMTMPMAPEMYPAQKSADMVWFRWYHDHGGRRAEVCVLVAGWLAAGIVSQ